MITTMDEDDDNSTFRIDFSDPLKELPYKIVFTIVFLFVFIFAFFGNLFVLILFAKCKSLRRKTNFLLGNLIVADFFVSIFCILPQMLEAIYELAINSAMCKVTHYAQGVAQRVSVLTLMAISIERYIVILKPMKSCAIHINKLRLVVASIWLFSLFYNNIYAVYYDFNPLPSVHYAGHGSCFIDWDWIDYYELTNITLFFILPSFLMIFVYLRILLCIYKTNELLYEPLHEANYNNNNFLKSAIAARHVAKRTIVRRNKDENNNKEDKLEFKSKSSSCLYQKSYESKQQQQQQGLAYRSRSFDEEVNVNELHKTLMNLRKIQLFQATTTATTKATQSANSSITSKCSLKIEAYRRKILKLMIIILCCFVFNSLPFTLLVFFNKAFQKTNPIPSREKIIIANIVYILYFTNSALNCFLYALYSSKFRKCATKEFPAYARILEKKDKFFESFKK